MKKWCLLVVCLLSSPCALAQGRAKATFEVASVRPSSHSGDGMTVFPDPAAVTWRMRNATLSLLVQYAYNLKSLQIETGKNLGWIETDTFDISAKPEGDKPLSYDEIRPLLQQLLEQRFHLSLRHAAKEWKGYALVAGKGPLRLKPMENPANSGYYIYSDRLVAPGASMDTLASLLWNVTRQPVVNKTAIPGNFDVKLRFAPEGQVGSEFPSIFTAIHEQAGLKLEPANVPVEMLVIDGASRVPDAD